MNGVRVWVLVTALALAGIAPVVPWARASGARSAHAVKSARMSMDQAVKMVEARFKARVVRADTRRRGGQVIYVMRLLDRNGRVFTVRVDASSGTVL